MEEMDTLKEQNNALISENKSLKDMIIQGKKEVDTILSHITAYQQTLNEVIQANISLKAGSAILEKNIEILKADLASKNNQQS